MMIRILLFDTFRICISDNLYNECQCFSEANFLQPNEPVVVNEFKWG